MRNIIVGTDLSARSERAIDRGANLARQFSASLDIVHVIDDELPKSVVDLQRESVEALLTRQIVNQGAFAGVRTNIHLLFGDPSKKLLKFADLKTADLIVLGTHRATGFLGRFGGTTVARIAAISNVPTLVVAQRVSGAYQRPVVGVDFSNCARNAARLASKMAPDQTLTFLNAYNFPFGARTTNMNVAGEASLNDNQKAEAELKAPMQSFENDLNISSEYEWLLVEGGPTVVLDREAKRIDADLICVGPHARSWLSRSLLGSTAEQLLADPPCDVLVTPL